MTTIDQEKRIQMEEQLLADSGFTISREDLM